MSTNGPYDFRIYFKIFKDELKFDYQLIFPKNNLDV